MVLLSCEPLRGELIDALVSEALFSHKVATDPQEEAEGIAVKRTESTGQILLLKRNLIPTTLGLLILNRDILVLQRYCLDNNNDLSIRLHYGKIEGGNRQDRDGGPMDKLISVDPDDLEVTLYVPAQVEVRTI